MRSFMPVCMCVAVASLLAACTPSPVSPSPAEVRVSAMQSGMLFRTTTVAGQKREYVVYVPRDYDPAKPLPAVVFLNGSGECGTDGQKQAHVGLGGAIMMQRERWPCIAIFPQKPDQPSAWADHDALVMACLSDTRAEFAIDASRIALTGLSQGGAGTWALGAKHPELWSAIAPVCGYGKPEEVAGKLKDMPIWAFHGEKDNVVPPQQTRDIVAAIEKAGGKPKATYYKDADHNSWDQAYRQSELAQWLLSQKRP